MLGLTLLLLILLEVPAIQDYCGNQLASTLSEKLGTRVTIGRVDVSLPSRLTADNVIIYDQEGQQMVEAKRLSASVGLISLAEGRFDISSAQLFGATFNLYKNSEQQPNNFQFVIDALTSTDSSEKKPLDLHIGSIIVRRGKVRYNRNYLPHDTTRFDPNHIDIKDISGHFRLRTLTNDSINAEIKKMSFNEQSGLKLNRLSMNFAYGKHAAQLKRLEIKMPRTQLSIDQIGMTFGSEQAYTSHKKRPFELSVPPISTDITIEESHITLADFAFLLPNLKNETSKISLSANIKKHNQTLTLQNLNVESDNQQISAAINGWIKDVNDASTWQININRFNVHQHTLDIIADNINDSTTNITKYIKRLGGIKLSGNASSNNGSDLRANIATNTSLGGAKAKLDIASDRTFNGTISIDSLHIGKLIDNDKCGVVVAESKINGVLSEDTSPTIYSEGQLTSAEYCGYTYRDIVFNADYKNKEAKGNISLSDPNATLSIAGQYSLADNNTHIDASVAIEDFCPAALNLSDKWGEARFKTNADVNINAKDLSNATGELSVNNFQINDSSFQYGINQLVITSGYNDNKKRYINLESDFGFARIVGDYDLATMSNDIINILSQELPALNLAPQKKSSQRTNIQFIANINDTEWCNRLLGIPLYVTSPSMIYAKVNNNINDLIFTVEMPSFQYNNTEYKNALLNLTHPDDSLRCTLTIDRKGKDDHYVKINATGRASNNTLGSVVKWTDSDNTDRFSGEICANTVFSKNVVGNQEFKSVIAPSYVVLDGNRWQTTATTIAYSKNNLSIDNFRATHRNKRLTINGEVSNSDNDSIRITATNLNTKYILDNVRFKAVKFSGEAALNAYIKTPFTTPKAKAKVIVNHFKFQDGDMGVLDANANWNNQTKRIEIKAVADNGPRSMTYINGYISPIYNDIQLDIKADGTSLAFLNSFTKSFAQDITGSIKGDVSVVGTLKQPNLVGNAVVNGEAFIKPLGCKYYLRNDAVRLTHNRIELLNIPLYDIYNNVAHLNGVIHHKNISKISYEMRATVDNLMLYDFKDFGNNTFYGTVFATGNVDIEGRSREFAMDANLTPQRGSSFTYNVAGKSSVANREFITWNDVSNKRDAGKSYDYSSHTPTAKQKADAKTSSSTPHQREGDVRLNLIINTNPNLTLRLLMNSATNDYITLNGNGVLNAEYYNKAGFDMFGQYNVSRGTYEMTIQDILKKNFTFNEGGTIVFGGDPYNATLNLQATHTVNSVSLSDLNVGNSYKDNTTKVNCLMNIGGRAMQPKVTFDIDLPTASNDERQMIRSILNSEDEMNQQVVYLLGIGRFYPQTNNNASAQSDNRQSETSLAMQSLLSGTLSGQINTLLNSMINNNNWTFGANISTGNEGWENAAYEGLLSGSLLNNRLFINGQFGYRDNAQTDKASFIGDFDVRYLLTPNGNFAFKIYNQTNDRYFTKSSLNTQGVGFVIKRDFNTLQELFGPKRKTKTQK